MTTSLYISSLGDGPGIRKLILSGKSYYLFMIPKFFLRKEIHHSSSPVTPISLEQIKQEQARMITRDTDWNLFDYGNVHQNKYSTTFFLNNSQSLHFIAISSATFPMFLLVWIIWIERRQNQTLAISFS